MSQCGEIRVFGLSSEAQNRLGGVTSVALDLPEGFSFQLSKDVEKLSIAGKISTEGALGFDLPFTRTNDAVFSAFKNPLTLDNQVQFYKVSAISDGHGLQFDRLAVTGRTDVWQCELRRSPDHWVELASQYTTNQIDFGDFNIEEGGYVEAHWEADAEYTGDYVSTEGLHKPSYWPLIDYGGWCDETVPVQGAENGRAVKAVGYEDLRPLLSLPYILKRGFCLFGWTIEGVIFDTEWAKRLWVYALKSDYYNASNNGGRITGRRFDTYEWTQNGAEKFLRFKELVKGLTGQKLVQNLSVGNEGFLCGVKNDSGIALKYTFRVKGEFFNDRSQSFLASFGIYEVKPDTAGPGYENTGEVLSTEFLEVDFSPNQKRQVVFEQTVTLKPGQSAAVDIDTLPTSGFKVMKGLYFETVPASKCFMLGDIITVKDCVSDSNTLLDWLKCFIHLCDGRIDTNLDTKTVTILPNKRADVFGTVAPGFLKVEEAAIDISDLIVSGSIQAKPVRPEKKRYTRLEFANSSDAYISSLNLSSPAHSRTIENGADLPDEIESLQNPVVEPTLEGQSTGLATDVIYVGKELIFRKSPYLPRLWDNTSGERSFEIGPRIFYAFGYIQQLNPEPGPLSPDYSNFFLNTPPNDANTGLVDQFGYVTQLRTWEVNPAPDIDGSVVFGTQKNDLFVIFYLGLTQEQQRGTVIDLLMRMKMKDYVKHDFRSLYAFTYNGIPLRVPMTGIRDFQTCSELPTPVTFFVEPADSDCCDLPCGCQFTTCEYYQDIGPYIRQDTLDALAISSFVVDGKELITTPVTLGKIEMVDVAGKPFVTNLVNALNSIGAPYFSFGISTRIHSSRGARFFTVKHLACVPFRILIKLSGAECYLYTQDEQKQKYFSGSWAALGYAPSTYTAPINCQTVTEY